MKGNGVPVTGKRCMFIPTLTAICTMKKTATPAPKSISKLLEPWSAFTMIRQMRIPYKAKRMTTPANPHSSAKAAKMKSV